MTKIIIEYKYRGNIELPDNRYAKDIFFRVKQAYANHEKMSISLIFSKNKLLSLKRYQKGSATDELENINLYIEPFEIRDSDIYLAANPDSLYLKKAEWEANLYDYGKTLKSFNFTKCDHGKNIADDVLLKEFTNLKLKNSDIYILTFDRELKERFTQETHQSNNLFVMSN